MNPHPKQTSVPLKSSLLKILPSKLKPGTRVMCHGRVMTFLERERYPFPGRERRCWFRCDEFIGLDGPKDTGRCYMGDSAVTRNCTSV